MAIGDAVKAAFVAQFPDEDPPATQAEIATGFAAVLAALLPPKAIVPFYLSAGDITAHFDGTGLGLAGGVYAGWAVCNGNNGTPPSLADRFMRHSNTAAGGTGGGSNTGKNNTSSTVQSGTGIVVAADEHTHANTPSYMYMVHLMRVG